MASAYVIVSIDGRDLVLARYHYEYLKSIGVQFGPLESNDKQRKGD